MSDEYWHIDITEGETTFDGMTGLGPWHFAILRGKDGDELVYSGAGSRSSLEAAKSAKRAFEQHVGPYPPSGWLFVNAPQDAKQYLMAQASRKLKHKLLR